jgi:hypothetical protein
MKKPFLCLLISVASVASGPVLAQVPTPAQALDLENRKVALAQETLDVQKDKNRDDKRREWTALVLTAFGAVAAALKYFGDQTKAREDERIRRKELMQQQENALQLKVLELAMAGDSPGVVANRLKVITSLVPGAKMRSVDKEEWSAWGFGTSVRRRETLLSLLAAASVDRRNEILEDWHRAFPNDNWVRSHDTGDGLVIDGHAIEVQAPRPA